MARVTPPLTITNAILTSSTAPEPDTGETAWVSGTTYAIGDQRYTASNHTIYERLTAGAGTTVPKDDPVNWAEVGPTNRWRMFDLLRNTKTTHASPLTVVLAPGKRVDAIGLVGLDADSVTITVKSGGVTVFTQTTALVQRQVTGWYEHYTAPFNFKRSVYIFGLPPYSGVEVTIAITRAGGDVSCGGVVLGKSIYLGRAIQGAQSNVLNFSKIERDEFGNAALTKRRSIPKATLQAISDKADLPRIVQARLDLNAEPALWTGTDDEDDAYYEPIQILGIFRDFTTTLDQPGPDLVTSSIDLEEI